MKYMLTVLVYSSFLLFRQRLLLGIIAQRQAQELPMSSSRNGMEKGTFHSTQWGGMSLALHKITSNFEVSGTCTNLVIGLHAH